MTRPIVVAVTGGVAAGKKVFASHLTKTLRKRNMKVMEVEHRKELDFTFPTNLDCVVLHGMMVPDDTLPLRKIDVKVYIDVDAEVRLERLLKQKGGSLEMLDFQGLRVNQIQKQRKSADIWIENSNSKDKLNRVADLIELARSRKEDSDSVEMSVFLDKYEKAPHTPVPGDFEKNIKHNYYSY